MPQPTPYSPSFSFSDFQAGAPTSPLPGSNVDSELSAIHDTLSGVLGNLVLIQRDDGKLADGCVTSDAMSASLKQEIADLVPGTPAQPVFTASATTLAPGAQATAQVSGTYPNLTIAIGVPKGDPGTSGTSVADADYGDVLVASNGSSWTVQTVGGENPFRPSNLPTVAQVSGLQADLDAKQNNLTFGHVNATDVLQKQDGDAIYQPKGTYVTAAQLAAKADAITTVNSFSASQSVSDGTHNGCYNMMTGATTRTITFGSGPQQGHCSSWVNRGTVNMTIACSGGYYKNGAAKATANLTLAPNGELSAFHEGSGVWKFSGNGF